MKLSDSRVLIIGSKGQLGSELQQTFASSKALLAYDREEIDVTSATAVRALVDSFRPDILLNASAYTAVDRAEGEPDAAMAINGYAPGLLAAEAKRIGALLVHYSTDYVFDGSKATPYVEGDAPSPLNVYGRTKLAGERAVAKVGGKYLTFRTSWVYSSHGNNFLLTMLRLGREKRELRVVDDQIGAPTTAADLARATHSIVKQIAERDWERPEEWAGLYHMTCSGKTSWCEFARSILTRSMGESVPEISGISTEQYPTVARRPKNSVLSNRKLMAKFGISLPDWSEALDEVLREVGEIVGAQERN